MVQNQDKFRFQLKNSNWKDQILIEESNDARLREYQDCLSLGFICKVNAWCT